MLAVCRASAARCPRRRRAERTLGTEAGLTVSYPLGEPVLVIIHECASVQTPFARPRPWAETCSRSWRDDHVRADSPKPKGASDAVICEPTIATRSPPALRRRPTVDQPARRRGRHPARRHRLSPEPGDFVSRMKTFVRKLPNQIVQRTGHVKPPWHSRLDAESGPLTDSLRIAS